MEARRTELEFDEFEKLLGEIPNATSGNPHSEGSGRKRLYLDENLSPACVHSYKEPLIQKMQNKGRLDEVKNLLNKNEQSPTKGVQQEDINLPDDQSLTSAFAELSFSHGVPMVSGNPPVAKSMQNYTSSLDGRFPNNTKKQNADIVMVVPSFRTPNNVTYGFYGFDMTKVGHESTNLSRVNPQEVRRRQVANCQPIKNFSAAVPLEHSTAGFPYLSNVPVPGVQFPVMSDQQQFFLESQAQVPYLHPQQMNQHQISWRNMEEEQHSMHQRHLLMQQFHNQQLEAQHLMPENGNIPSKLISRNLRQPHFEVPISHQFEKLKQEPYWNSYAMTRGGSNQSNPAFSPVEFNAVKAWEKVVKQGYPEKILTRSHGLNTLNPVKFGSVGANESLTHVGQNRKLLPNGHFFHNLSNASSYQSGNVRSWDLYSDAIDLKSAGLKLLPQKYNSLDEVTGRIYLMAKDQHGCRFLQRKFAEGSQKEVEMIFDEIIDHIVELMTDPFGNYLVQKLLEVCDEDQRMQILHSVTRKSGELCRISCDMHGTRAVQKVIETLKTPEQFSMVVSSLEPDTMTLVRDMNGNHVAQQCLKYLMPEHTEFLFEAANVNCIELATDRHGCCVLQKCLTFSDGERRSRLIREIASNALILSQDPFGNYAVQFVFELQLPWATEDIIHQLEGSYADLSVQKYSSNVVEKVLNHADEERRTRIIQELIDNPRLDQIMQDPYGNYVIQTALNQSEVSVRAKLEDAIKRHLTMLRTSPYGKKVVSRYNSKK